MSTASAKEKRSIDLNREVLVLGGGIAGITVAQSLADAGFSVTVVEKTKEFGGKARQRCFFPEWQDGDLAAGLGEGISRLEQAKNVTFLFGAELRRLDGHFGSFRAVIEKDSGETIALQPAAVVAATGYATQRETPGIPAFSGICYPVDLEKLLNESPGKKLLWQGKTVSSVTFLLDQVNYDIKIDTINVLNLALALSEKFNCQVSVLCRDLKVSFPQGERLYRRVREAGVLFYKYDEPPRFSLTEGRLCVETADMTSLKKEEEEKVRINSDLLVLPETCLPGRETEKLCHILNIRMDKQGYLMDDNPQFGRIRSNRRGIFIAGACRFPQDLRETQAEAEATAEEVVALLGPGVYEYGELVAEVDASKCALCYTCPRLCPHSAIRIEKYARGNVYRLVHNADEVMGNAARVEPAACYGCGICVAECPARAISLLGEDSSSQDLVSQQGALERRH